MPPTRSLPKRFLPALLILFGACLALLALSADLLGVGGQSGLGLRQLLLLVGGGGLVCTGIFWMSPASRRLARFLATQPPDRRRPVPPWLVAVWFGLLAGLGEVSILAYRKTFDHILLLRSRHYPWMVPMGDVLIFLATGLALVLLWRRSRTIPLRLTVFLFAGLSFAAWLFLLPKIHILAALVLALGLALQLSRWIARRPGGFFWTVRFSTPFLAATVVLLMGGMLGGQAWAERQALSRLPAAVPGTPNVLLIVMDTVRAQSLSLYGYTRPTTPNLERLASQGVRFEQAFATAPWTLPSHASMFTGRWHHELSVDWSTPLDDKYPTLAEVLSRRGYATAGFVANNLNCGYEGGLQRGFNHYDDYLTGPVQILLSTSLARELENRLQPIYGPHRLFLPKTAEDVNAAFLDWEARHTDRPFFAFLNYMDAHGPYQVPAPFDRRFGDPARRSRSHTLPSWQWTPDQIQAEIDAYDGAVAYLDDQIGRLFTELDARDLSENTVIIITSDHGEQFGEHKLFGHANSLYTQALQVPLLVLSPSVAPAGATVAQPVSLRDLPATVLDLASIEPGRRFPGASLARFWEQGPSLAGVDPGPILSEVFPGSEYQKYSPANKGGMKSLVIGQRHYILNGDGSEELYDLERDASEGQNLAQQDEERQVLEQFRSSLQAILLNTTAFLRGLFLSNG